MATTTTNYGFDVPTSSDLVKNGATQIALLGQDIDTFLFRPFVTNYCINGGMDIWQRGTSFSITAANPSYTADRWTQYFGGTGTIAQETTTVPTGSQYALKMTSTSTNGGIAAYQLVEYANVVPLQGKTITLSYQAAGTTQPGLTLFYSTTANDTLTNCTTNISATALSNPTVSTSLQQFAFSATIPSAAKTLRIGIVTGSVVNTNYVIFGNVQLEIGSVNTPFIRTGRDIQGELALCQRYYYRTTTPNYAYGTFGTGIGESTTAIQGIIPLPVTMRTSPTAVDYSSNLRVSDASASTAVSSLTLDTSKTSLGLAYLNLAFASGITQYRNYFIQASNSTSSYIGVTAEL